MAFVYARRHRLYCKVKASTGKWTAKPTPFDRAAGSRLRRDGDEPAGAHGQHEHRWRHMTTTDLENRAIKLLSLMDKPIPMIKVPGTMRTTWSAFDAPLVPSLCGKQGDVFPDATPRDVGWKVDSRVAFLGDGESGYELQVQTLRSINRTQARGLVHERYMAFPGLFEMGVASIDGGKLVAQRHFWAFGKTWVEASNTHQRITGGDRDAVYGTSPLGSVRVQTDQSEHRRLSLMVGLALTSEYEWRAQLRLGEGRMTVSFFVNPAAIRTLFALRDIPEGSKRRDSLLHWVSAHARMVSNGDDITWVRRHLRGRQEFTWAGMSGAIIPSADAVRESRPRSRS